MKRLIISVVLACGALWPVAAFAHAQETCAAERDALQRLEEASRACDLGQAGCPVQRQDCSHIFDPNARDACDQRNRDKVAAWHRQHDAEMARLRERLQSPACNPPPPHAPLVYHGGTVLTSFRMYPLFYGAWTKTENDLHWSYLSGLAQYISGQNAATGQIPMLRQYGVISATVAPKVMVSPGVPATVLSDMEIQSIIHVNQVSGNLPAFGEDTLIVVFLAPGFSLNITGGCAYHASLPGSAFYGVIPVPPVCGPKFLVTAHEVFEAATNPDGNGWWSNSSGEAVDNCTSTFNEPSVGAITGAADNTQGGTCSVSGYIPGVPTAEKYGYLWADASAGANATYQYNSTGAANTVARSGQGTYVAKFPGLADYDKGTVNVTAYGSSNDTCKVERWNSVDADLLVTVRCFTSTGLAADTSFTVSYSSWRGFSDFTYLWSSDENSTSNQNSASYNPSGYLFTPYSSAPPTVTRAGTGDYTVRIPSQAQASLRDPHGGGIVNVTAYGSRSESCKVAWWGIGEDLVARILCFSAAGDPADSRFAMTYHRKTDLLGRFSTNHAYVWADQETAASYVPVHRYQFNTQPGELSITRSGAGAYSVKIPGQGQTGGHVQVTAYGTGAERCKVESWGLSGADQFVRVRCFNARGSPADAKFTLSYVAGGASAGGPDDRF